MPWQFALALAVLVGVCALLLWRDAVRWLRAHRRGRWQVVRQPTDWWEVGDLLIGIFVVTVALVGLVVILKEQG